MGDAEVALESVTRNQDPIGAQLQRNSFAFSQCLLCIEGSAAFQQKIADQIPALFSTARHSNVALQYFYSLSQASTEVCQSALWDVIHNLHHRGLSWISDVCIAALDIMQCHDKNADATSRLQRQQTPYGYFAFVHLCNLSQLHNWIKPCGSFCCNLQWTV